jgi:3',5'-cyclic AMP phosphodiesterase CpdA
MHNWIHRAHIPCFRTALPLLIALAMPACGDEAAAPGPVQESLDAGEIMVLPGPKQDTAPARPEAIDALEEDTTGPSEPAFECPSIPTAYFLDTKDPYTNVLGTEAVLREAGFDVKPLPLDQPPAQLRGVIVLGSFSSTSPEYQAYMSKYGSDLFNFVDRANVLVQLTQADQNELTPPFLPTTHLARRSDLDLSKLYVLDPESPLLAGARVQDKYLAWQGGTVGWETFVSQGGFEVILAEDASGKNATLLEGAYGQGRLILAAMALDKVAAPATEAVFFRQIFFANLLPHVVNVCQRKTAAVKVTASSAGKTFASGSFMFAALPDTQVYSQLYPGLFNAQTSWIASTAKKRNIAYVFHLGDITNNNTPIEWEHAADAFSILDGVVPYAIVPGNHDYGPSGDASTRETLMNDYLSYARISAWTTFGGAYQTGKLDNTYHLFSVGKRDFVLLALEFGPRDEVIQWANTIMTNNPDRYGIMITHAYLNNNDLRYDWKDTGHPQDFDPHFYATPGVNDGEELWQKLVRKHRFIMVVNGHVLGDGTGYLASKTDTGITCHQVLANYQFRTLGGEDYMRLFEFLADGRTVRVHTYSPLYDSFLNDPDQSFSFVLDWP